MKDTEDDERDAIIDSIVCSQGLAGVPVTREMAAAALDRALQKPLATIGAPFMSGQPRFDLGQPVSHPKSADHE